METNLSNEIFELADQFPGEHILLIWRMQKSKWGWCHRNPQGGSFTTTCELQDVKNIAKSVIDRTTIDPDVKVKVIVGKKDVFDPFVFGRKFLYSKALGVQSYD